MHKLIDERFSHLIQYVQSSNALAVLQLVLFAILVYLLFERTIRVVEIFDSVLPDCDRVSNQVMDELTRLCFALGLLLTFSGLYTYVSGGGSAEKTSLLLALGSSAVGYSAWTVSAIAAVIDSLRGTPGESRTQNEKTGGATEFLNRAGDQAKNELKNARRIDRPMRTNLDETSADVLTPKPAYETRGVAVSHSVVAKGEAAFGERTDDDVTRSGKKTRDQQERRPRLPKPSASDNGEEPSDKIRLPKKNRRQRPERVSKNKVEQDHESQSVTGPDSGSRHLGRPLHNSIESPVDQLGSLGSYQRIESTSDIEFTACDSDLAEEERGDGDLASDRQSDVD